jgi:hypothetical protein
MSIRWLKFVAWSAVAALVCWCYAFLPAWRVVATLFVAAVPLLLWRTQQFQDAIHPLGAAAILAAAALLVILSFAGSTEWLPRWIGAGSLRPISAILIWLALTAPGFYVLIKEPAA